MTDETSNLKDFPDLTVFRSELYEGFSERKPFSVGKHSTCSSPLQSDGFEEESYDDEVRKQSGEPDYLARGVQSLSAEWSALIGPDPSRYCALIGWTLLCWHQGLCMLSGFHAQKESI